MFGREIPTDTCQEVYSKWQRSSAERMNIRYGVSDRDEKAYNQIVVAKRIRVPLSSEILSDRTILEVIILVDHEFSSACVEPQDVIE